MSRAVVAVSVAVTLGLTAACGGGGDEQGAEGKPAGATPTKAADEAKTGSEGGGGGAASGDAKRPLTEAQLEKAALVSDDTKDYKVAKTPEGDIPAGAVPAEPAACQPIADMFFFGSTPRAEGRTARTLTARSDLNATVVSLALLAHDEQSDAEKVMAGLRTASTSCTAYEHADYEYSGVKALPAPQQGDEAVSYKLKGSIEGTSVPMTFTIVRSGSTLAAFFAMNVRDADKAQVPADVVEAQLTKLEKAAG